VLAIESSPLPFEAALRAPEERLGQYSLLRRLPAGLRAEVWLGLPPGGASLGQLVAIKAFFPHARGPAAAALAAELSLAPRLVHPNVVQTLRIGRDAQRPFIVSEHLEGTTLRALLRRVRVARASAEAAAVARVLLGIVRAVGHAQRQAKTAAERALAAQAVAADDVFITFDGAVKLLGFKAQLEGVERRCLEFEAPNDATAPAAIDALLSEHLTPELRGVLGAACRPGSGSGGLARVGQELERWQTEVLRSDGRAELAELVEVMFPSARLEQRAQLDALLEQWMSARSLVASFAADNDAAPASGFRTIRPEA